MRIKRQVASSSTTTDEAGEAQVESSGTNIPDVDSSNPFSPDAASAARSNSFSPPPARSQSSNPSLQPPTASLQPSPLPSFHTLRDPVAQSTSAASSQSSSFSQSSPFGVSSGVVLQQLSSPAEQSPFSSLLSQLSTASQSPLPPGHSPGLYGAGHHLEHPAPPFAVKSSPSPGRESPARRKLQPGEGEKEGEGGSGVERELRAPGSRISLITSFLFRAAARGFAQPARKNDTETV